MTPEQVERLIDKVRSEAALTPAASEPDAVDDGNTCKCGACFPSPPGSLCNPRYRDTPPAAPSPDARDARIPLWRFTAEADRLPDGKYRVMLRGNITGEVRESVGVNPLWEFIRLVAAESTHAHPIAGAAVEEPKQ